MAAQCVMRDGQAKAWELPYHSNTFTKERGFVALTTIVSFSYIGIRPYRRTESRKLIKHPMREMCHSSSKRLRLAGGWRVSIPGSRRRALRLSVFHCQGDRRHQPWERGILAVSLLAGKGAEGPRSGQGSPGLECALRRRNETGPHHTRPLHSGDGVAPFGPEQPPRQHSRCWWHLGHYGTHCDHHRRL
jgi:hypothetical protein